MKLIITAFFLLSGCSVLQKVWPNKQLKIQNYQYLTKKDYLDHLSSLGDDYLKSQNVYFINTSGVIEKYLKQLFARIAESNELLINRKQIPKFYILKDKTPFHFSLPGQRHFLSLGLLNKYIKNEVTLASIIAYEATRSSNGLYLPRVIVPTGQLNSRDMLSLTRIDLDYKMEVNKRAFYILKRSGFDPIGYLRWIQLQNKNTLDFAQLHGDAISISKEEFTFKSFIINNRLSTIEDRKLENSSPLFYSFKSVVNKMVL